MLSLTFVLLLLVVVISSAMLTGIVRRYALSKNILDQPNARSSHTAPTPRGGGVAIVIAFLGAVVVLGPSLSAATQLALLVGGCGVAAIGFIDDHGHIPARWRLSAHFLSAIWIVYWLGTPSLEWMGRSIDLGYLGAVLAVLYLVWMLNLYNFMDGIDGIAGMEAVIVGAAGAIFYWVNGSLDGSWELPALLAAASLGFVVWNFPPAKIFMGDAGSGFLGVMLGAFSLQAAVVQPILLWSWLVLMGVFIVDATTTLLRRLICGARVYEAHRSHAYQNASRAIGNHLPVTLAVAGINLMWLLPWALAIAAGKVSGVIGLLCAYTPLLILAFRYQAGLPEEAKV